MASIEASKFRLKIVPNDLITGPTGRSRYETVETSGTDWR